MKQKKNKSRMFGWMALFVFGFGLVAAIFGLSSAVTEIEEISVSKTPEAILENAGLNEENKVSLSVLYYDQKADECVNLYDLSLKEALENRQFEWSDCGYYYKGIEKGLVEFELNDKYSLLEETGYNILNKLNLYVSDSDEYNDVHISFRPIRESLNVIDVIETIDFLKTEKMRDIMVA